MKGKTKNIETGLLFRPSPKSQKIQDGHQGTKRGGSKIFEGN